MKPQTQWTEHITRNLAAAEGWAATLRTPQQQAWVETRPPVAAYPLAGELYIVCSKRRR